MPARKTPPTFSDAYYAVSRDLLPQLGDSLAQQAGAPASIEVQPVTDRVRVRAWNQKHPAATPEASFQVAQQSYARHRAAGLPDADARRAPAEDVTHFMYRARMPLYTQGTTEWKEQVAEAERLARLSKRTAEQPSPQGPGAGTATGQTVTATPTAATGATPPESAEEEQHGY